MTADMPQTCSQVWRSVITTRMLQTKKTAIIELERHQFHIRMPSMCHLPSFEEGIVHIPLSFTGEISFVTSYEGSDKRIQQWVWMIQNQWIIYLRRFWIHTGVLNCCKIYASYILHV